MYGLNVEVLTHLKSQEPNKLLGGPMQHRKKKKKSKYSLKRQKTDVFFFCCYDFHLTFQTHPGERLLTSVTESGAHLPGYGHTGDYRRTTGPRSALCGTCAGQPVDGTRRYGAESVGGGPPRRKDVPSAGCDGSMSVCDGR